MSKKILFISSQRQFRQLVSTFLSSTDQEVEIEFAASVSESIKFLSEAAEFDFI
jgi:hypothetical protein